MKNKYGKHFLAKMERKREARSMILALIIATPLVAVMTYLSYQVTQIVIQ